MTQTPSNILALDVGDKRVGVALASMTARLPRPLTTLERHDKFFEDLKKIIKAEEVDLIVVGMPRDLNGRETLQTKATEHFIKELNERLDVKTEIQDEAVTSKQAEAELKSRNIYYSKGEIDALAATYILEDFLNGYNGTE